MQGLVTPVFTFLTLVSNVAFVLVVLAILALPEFRKKVYIFVNKNINWLLFVFAFFATVGSLFYSNVVGFPPCDLCWFQRIFMYPQVLLAFIAVVRKEKNIVYYLLPMSIVGIIISLYHSLVHWRIISGSLLSCTSSLTAPCAKVYVLSYGYITIPFMALSAFAYLITISIIYHKSSVRG